MIDVQYCDALDDSNAMGLSGRSIASATSPVQGWRLLVFSHFLLFAFFPRDRRHISPFQPVQSITPLACNDPLPSIVRFDLYFSASPLFMSN